MNEHGVRGFLRHLDIEQLDEEARRARRLPALLDVLREAYPDPLRFDTAESFARSHHDDIREMPDETLEDERLLSLLRRAVERRAGVSPTAWLAERIAHLNGEAARRRKAAGAR